MVATYTKVATGSDGAWAKPVTFGTGGCTIIQYELSAADSTFQVDTAGVLIGTTATSADPVTSAVVSRTGGFAISAHSHYKSGGGGDTFTVNSNANSQTFTNDSQFTASARDHAYFNHLASPTVGATCDDSVTWTALTDFASLVLVVLPTGGPVLVGTHSALDTSVDTASLVTGSFTPSNGDVLVIKAVTSDSSLTFGTPTGGSLSYTSQFSVFTTSFTGVQIWTAVVSGSPGSMTVTVPVSGTAHTHGMVVEHWTNASLAATPATGNAQAATGSPSASLTTAADGSVVSFVNADWNEILGARTYSTASAVLPFEELSQQSDAHYVGDWASQAAGAAGSQTFGLSAPTGQKWTLVGIEVQGPAPPSSAIVPAWIDAAENPTRERPSSRPRSWISRANPPTAAPTIIVPMWVNAAESRERPARRPRSQISLGRPPVIIVPLWIDAAENPARERPTGRPRSVIRPGSAQPPVIGRWLSTRRRLTAGRPRSGGLRFTSRPAIIVPPWIDAAENPARERPAPRSRSGIRPGSFIPPSPPVTPIVLPWAKAPRRTPQARPRTRLATGRTPGSGVAFVPPPTPWVKSKARRPVARSRSVLRRVLRSLAARFNFCDLNLGGAVTGNGFGGTATANLFGGTAVVTNKYGGTATANLFGGTAVVTNKYGGTATETNQYGGAVTDTNLYGGSITCPSN